MAYGDRPDAEATMRALFGTMVRAAQEGATTAQVWERLRQAAGAYLEPGLRIKLGRDPTMAESAAAVREFLHGVDAGTVSTFRSIAGQQVRAHKALRSRPTDQQITAECIFVPPWHVSGRRR